MSKITLFTTFCLAILCGIGCREGAWGMPDQLDLWNRLAEEFEKKGAEWNIQQLKAEKDVVRLMGHAIVLRNLDEPSAVQPILEVWRRIESGELKLETQDPNCNCHDVYHRFSSALRALTGGPHPDATIELSPETPRRVLIAWELWLKEHPPEAWEEFRAMSVRATTNEKVFPTLPDIRKLAKKGLDANIEALRKEKKIARLGAHARALSLLGGPKAADAILEVLLKLERRDWADLKASRFEEWFERGQLRQDLDWDLARLTGRDITKGPMRKTYAGWKEWMKDHPPETWLSVEEIKRRTTSGWGPDTLLWWPYGVPEP